MKRLFVGTFILVLMTFLLAFATYYDHGSYSYSTHINSTPTVEKIPSNDSYFIPSYGKSFIGFKEAIAFKESRGKYSTVNTLGYMGRYQFGKSTLSLMNINDSLRFLKSPKLQEKAFISYLSYNKWLLQEEIKQYHGKVINGIEITESGILAAAHLAGAGSVKRYLKSNGRRGARDSYGTRIEDYFRKFGNYDVSVIEANEFPNI